MRSERSPEPTFSRRSAARVASMRWLLGVVDARAQDVHRGSAVLVLRAAVLHHHHDAGRNVGDADRRFGLVDVLAAGAAGAHGLDAQIVVLDLDVDLLDLGQHRNRRRRGVDAALRFGIGHALHPMHAGFEFQFGERAAARTSAMISL